MLLKAFRNTLVAFVCLSLSGLFVPMSAAAGVIGTDEYLATKQRQVHIERINQVLMRDSVHAKLTSLGVNPTQAKQRVAALTDTDLMKLDQELQNLPAGGGALELVLVVFLILLILDLTGLTDIFPSIGPGKVR